MKTFVMKGAGQTGWMEKEKPTCGPLDAICKPLAVAACTSDVHTVWENALGPRKDLTLGHEAVGEVIEVGSLVKDFKKGDRVLIAAITPDWGTVASQGGNSQHSAGILSGWKYANVKDGVFAEYFHVNEADANMAHMPKNMDLGVGVMLADMVSTGVHAAEIAKIEFGDTVAVLGIGPVGLMCVRGAYLRGASTIIAVDSGRPNCWKVAQEYGATDFVDYTKDTVKQILEMTGGQGVDRVLVAGGNKDILVDAISVLKPGGYVGNVNYFGTGEFISIPRVEWGVGMSHKTIVGGLMPGGRRRMERLSALVMSGRIDPSKLITHRFEGLDSVEKMLLLMKDKPADLIKPVAIIK